MLLNKEIPVVLKLTNGEQVVGKVLEFRITGADSPFGRACLLLEDVATFSAQRHPQKQNELIYTMLQWQFQETYIPWDKIMSFGIASEMVQDQYRSVFQRVQVADINEVNAMQRGSPGTKVVIETP